MRTITKRSQPGHFCCSDRCLYFEHTDIDDELGKTIFCVSTVGEYLDGNINISGKKYETMVFDLRNEETRWSEIETVDTNTRSQTEKAHADLVKKYMSMP